MEGLIIFTVGCVTLYLLGKYKERANTLEKEKHGHERSWVGKVIDVTLHKANEISRDTNHDRYNDRIR